MAYGKALTALSDRDLENILRRVHKAELPLPVTTHSLHAAGLSYLVDKVDFLLGFEEQALRAVLVAVFAERREARRRQG